MILATNQLENALPIQLGHFLYGLHYLQGEKFPSRDHFDYIVYNEHGHRITEISALHKGVYKATIRDYGNNVPVVPAIRSFLSNEDSSTRFDSFFEIYSVNFGWLTEYDLIFVTPDWHSHKWANESAEAALERFKLRQTAIRKSDTKYRWLES